MPSPGRLPRRAFLTAAAAGVGGVVAASWRSGGRTAPPDERSLVLVDLAGGNDGLGTVVPAGDERYRRLRGRLALDRAEVRRLAPGVGLHPALPRLADRFAAGGLAIVEGVGSTPAPRTHEEAADAADAVEVDPVRTGWLGRLADGGLGPGRAPALVSLGAEPPPAFAARGGVSAALGVVPERRASFAEALDRVADRIAARAAARVHHVRLPGFDTHAQQAHRHARLLAELDRGLDRFLRRLEADGALERTLVVCRSEFGRRPAPNVGGGTDHGTAGPVLVLGAPRHLRGGFHGVRPDLAALDENGDLPVPVDVRRVHATVVERWFERSAAPVVGRARPLPFLA